LGGIEFQRKWEQKAYQLGGRNYHAPCQLVGDFMSGEPSIAGSSVLPSYRPGVQMTDLGDCLPPYVIQAIQEALPEFNKKIPGFMMENALLTGVETRTSSPVRILRGKDYQSVKVRGLYPVGEGSGYAGGILSSAMDGIKGAEALLRSIEEEL
jgi:uncharacterized FAD-dependent dehydrogenase